MDYIGYIAASLTTISFLPQVILTLKTKNTQSISLSMYIIFVAGTSCWLAYGILLQSTPMVLANLVTVLLSSIVLFLKILEKMKNARH